MSDKCGAQYLGDELTETFVERHIREIKFKVTLDFD